MPEPEMPTVDFHASWVSASSELRTAKQRLSQLEELLWRVVSDEDVISDPSTWCSHCENYVRRHEGHKYGCVIPEARLLLGMPTPPMEQEVLDKYEQSPD